MVWPVRCLLLLLTLPILLGTAASVEPLFVTSLEGSFFDSTLWQTPGILRSALSSLALGLLTPALALTSVLLFLSATQGSRASRIISSLSAPVLALPHAAAAFGFALLVAPTGVLSRLIAVPMGWELPPDYLFLNHPSGIALLTGLVLKEAPFILLVSLAALPSLDAPRRVALSRSLGYRPMTGWFFTVLPALYPLIRLPLFAVLVFSSSTVDVALILGPSLPPTLSVRLLEWFVEPTLESRQLAAAAGCLQVVISLAAIGLWIGGEKVVCWLYRRRVHRGPACDGPSLVAQLTRKLAVSLFPLGLTVTGAGMAALALSSVARGWRYPALLPSEWTLGSWHAAFSGFSIPLLNTVLIATLSVAFAVGIVLLVLESDARSSSNNPLATWLLYLPLLIPQVVFLSGLTAVAERAGLSPSLLLVTAGHCLFVLPYIYLTLRSAYSGMDKRWLRLAATLGASPLQQFLRVRLPLLSSPIITACMLGLTISLSLYLPTQLLGAGRVPTLTTEAVALVSAGSRGAIGTWALLQSALPTLCFVVALVLPRLLWSRRKGMLEGRR